MVVAYFRRPSGRANLEVRFSQSEPYRFGERNYTLVRYRVGVYDAGSIAADNVGVVLRDIEPRPRNASFRGDFPYLATPTTGEQSNRTRRINPGHEELFEVLSFWWNYDRTMFLVGRLDTKTGTENDGAFVMEDGESWLLHYLVTSANANALPVTLRATRVGDEVRLARL